MLQLIYSLLKTMTLPFQLSLYIILWLLMFRPLWSLLKPALLRLLRLLLQPLDPLSEAATIPPMPLMLSVSWHGWDCSSTLALFQALMARYLHMQLSLYWTGVTWNIVLNISFYVQWVNKQTFLNVTLDHKTSLKSIFDIYISHERWIIKLSIDV